MEVRWLHKAGQTSFWNSETEREGTIEVDQELI